jgi:glutamate racemase
MSDARPIGIFDSGVGGLTVVHEVFKRLPGEQIVYFGDTARVPYGTKSPKVVQHFAMQDVRFLLQKDVKMIVVACHTVSSVAMDALLEQFQFPILGVVVPGVRAALEATRNRRIGVIGTKATAVSKSYETHFMKLDPRVRVFSQACPLFVPLAEEGWLMGEITKLIAEKYLNPLKAHRIDTLILGCTHYPLLKSVIQEVLGDGVTLIDSAEETARAVEEKLVREKIENPGHEKAEHRFFVSDIPHQFRDIGERFLGQKFNHVQQIDLESMDMDAEPIKKQKKGSQVKG